MNTPKMRRTTHYVAGYELAIVILSAALLLSLFLGFNTQREELNMATDEAYQNGYDAGYGDGYDEAQSAVLDLKDENEELINQQKALLNGVLEIQDEYSFWKSHAVIVTAAGEKYHAYGCPHVTDKTFWIYNIELAKAKGHEPCLDCKPMS